VERHLERFRKVVADAKDALGRLPYRQVVALPRRDRRVRLQCRVQSDLRAVFARDRDVGSAEPGVDVAAAEDAR
jgi:hypothetical protein